MGNLLCDLLVCAFVAAHHITGDLRVDEAGIYRVHMNAVLDVFQRGRSREPNYAVLRGDVGWIPGLPVSAPTEALLTIAPLPCRCICCSSYFMQLHTPRKLIPITRSQSSRVLSLSARYEP